MKNLILLIILSYSGFLFAQVGIGTVTPHPSSILEVNSTTKGFLPPVMTNDQIVGIINPAEGLIAFSSDENCLVYFRGSQWFNVCTQTEINVTNNFTLSPTRLKSNNIDISDYFGWSVEISGDGNTLVATSIFESSDAQGVDNNNSSQSGAVYVYNKIGGNWGSPIRLKADNIESGDQFGYSVDLSEDGNVLAVGVRVEDSDAQGVDNNNAHHSGAAYVYRRIGGVWGSATRLKADNIGVSDFFGVSISLSSDGNTLVVGADSEDSDAQGVDNNNALNSGAVYVFKFTGGTWSAPIRLKANNVGADDHFGVSVSLSSDGNTLAVGAIWESSDGLGVDNNNLTNSGAVYIFRFTGGSWSTPTRLKADNIGANDYFGVTIALNGDGNTLAVGSSGESSDGLGVDNNNSTNSGAVYVFKFTGGAWSSPTRLKADNIGAEDRFGLYVSLSEDGNTLGVGAFNEDSDAQGVDNDNASNSGAVYVFRNNGGWGTPTRLKADNISDDDQFGRRLGLSDDGNTLVTSATKEDSDAQGVDNNLKSNSGAIYIFE